MRQYGHHWYWWNRRRHRRRYIVALVVGNFAVELTKGDTINMATTLNVGQTLPLSIRFLDQDGKEMSPTPTPDSPPQWAQSNSLAELLTQTADGLSATVVASAAGDDTISLDMSVGGRAFSAILQVTVAGVVVVPVLTGIEIVPGTPTP